MFMFHPDIKNIGIGKYYANDWKGYKEKSHEELCSLITKHAVSHCLWAKGKRKEVNFLVSDWLGLDFDENMSLAKALSLFKDYSHIIGTTKSHQKLKNDVICDRFRVFLKFEKSCFKKDDFKETVKWWIYHHGADEKCKDAARFFWPCKDIISINENGCKIGFLDAKKIEERKQKQINKLKKRQLYEKTFYKTNNSKDKKIPAHIQAKLDLGVMKGHRNTSCFGMTKDLKRLGFSKSEIEYKILNSQLIQEDFTKAEAQKAINSGWNRS